MVGLQVSMHPCLSINGFKLLASTLKASFLESSMFSKNSFTMKVGHFGANNCKHHSFVKWHLAKQEPSNVRCSRIQYLCQVARPL